MKRLTFMCVVMGVVFAIFATTSLALEFTPLVLPKKPATPLHVHPDLATDLLLLSGNFDVRRTNELRANFFKIASEQTFVQSTYCRKQAKELLSLPDIKQVEFEDAVVLESLADSFFKLATWQYEQYQSIQTQLQAVAVK